MTKLNVTGALAGAATAAALMMMASGNALAHGGGIGGHMGGSIGGNMGRNTATLVRTDKVPPIGDHDGRRFRFHRFGYVGVVTSPVCLYKWTNLGPVRVCPDLDY